VKYGVIDTLRQQYPVVFMCCVQRARETYGTKRSHRDLTDHGVEITPYRVRVLRKKLNLYCKQKRKFKVTTDSKHHLPFAPNILKREFAVSAPDKDYRIYRGLL
jgi:putative transposase